MDLVQLACDREILLLPIHQILPVRQISEGSRSSQRYRRIASSIHEIGLIEPVIVHPCADQTEQYLLLDGHVRLDVLRRSGVKEVECLVSHDDEAFTYNHKVNQLSPIQEHFMLCKAIEKGVSEEAIARTLNVDVSRIREKRDLLNGICPEAVELLRQRNVPRTSIQQLRKTSPLRQIEIAELMCASHNYSTHYAKCLLAATPQDQLLDKEKPKKVDELSPQEMARMEKKMQELSKDFRQLEKSHGKNVLRLVIVTGYLRKLLDSAPVVRYLAERYPEFLAELQKIAESRSLAEATVEPEAQRELPPAPTPGKTNGKAHSSSS